MHGVSLLSLAVQYRLVFPAVSLKEKRTAGTVDEIDFFKGQEVWHDGPYYMASYTPQSGDIIYFYSADSDSHRHVGIVTGVSDGYVHTIEGNTSGNDVARNDYSLSNSKIVGYSLLFMI